ncbi:MAG: hypothetical protein GY754_09205 [bacterium]|nr:hypothetical protein [bacterium]
MTKNSPIFQWSYLSNDALSSNVTGTINEDAGTVSTGSGYNKTYAVSCSAVANRDGDYTISNSADLEAIAGYTSISGSLITNETDLSNLDALNYPAGYGLRRTRPWLI